MRDWLTHLLTCDETEIYKPWFRNMYRVMEHFGEMWLKFLGEVKLVAKNKGVIGVVKLNKLVKNGGMTIGVS